MALSAIATAATKSSHVWSAIRDSHWVSSVPLCCHRYFAHHFFLISLCLLQVTVRDDRRIQVDWLYGHLLARCVVQVMPPPANQSTSAHW